VAIAFISCDARRAASPARAFAAAPRDDGKTPASCKMEMFSETVARAGSCGRGELQEIINVFMPMGCEGLFLGLSVPTSAPAMQQISRQK
jgi:hypothetical protein